jgi:2-keto-4-pentenoate hydratase/2-oxohepta-3-ene-1,7-dioic acid hydratase in catechol pathway
LHPAPISEQLDWEVELAVVIGTPGRDIPEEAALRHVFGYTVGNDVSVRDVQRRHGGQWFKGKNFDTHCPLGPWIVTADELGDPHNLHITLRVNGVTKQDSSTRFMVFRVPRIIKEFSTGVMLQPGDVMLTGTPEGVGFARTPPEFLKVGDVMEAEIEKIGVLRNAVAKYEASALGGELSAARAT